MNEPPQSSQTLFKDLLPKESSSKSGDVTFHVSEIISLNPHAETRLVHYFGKDHWGKDWKFCAKKGSDFPTGARLKLFHRSPSKTKILTFSVHVRGGTGGSFTKPEIKEISANAADDWVLVFKQDVPLNKRGRTYAEVEFKYQRSAFSESDRKDLFCEGERKALSADFKSLFLSSEAADVIFEVGQDTVPAHQLILSTRLPYFKQLFASGMQEAISKRIQIVDVDAPAFKKFLQFIYSGDFPEDLDAIPEIYLPIADRYDSEVLKNACATALKKKISVENVVSILILADLHQCRELKRKSIRRLAEWKSSVAEEDLEQLKPHPSLMFEFIKVMSSDRIRSPSEDNLMLMSNLL